jgi:hypothetical protein
MGTKKVRLGRILGEKVGGLKELLQLEIGSGGSIIDPFALDPGIRWINSRGRTKGLF